MRRYSCDQDRAGNRRQRRTWPLKRCAALACTAYCLVAGCTSDVPVRVEPQQTESVLLASEAFENDWQRFVATGFEFVNPGSRPAELELVSTGCACYRVVADGRPIENGERLTLPGDGRISVALDVRPPTAPGRSEYRAEFRARQAGKSALMLPVTCAVRMYADVKVRPDVIAFDEQPPPTLEIEVEQHVRSENRPEMRIEWRDMPEFLRCVRTELLQPPAQIAPAVWRARWRSVLTVEAAASAAEGTYRSAVASLVRSGYGEAIPASGSDSRSAAIAAAVRVSEPADVGRATPEHRAPWEERARSDLVLLLRRAVGIQAPHIVHFGRVPDRELRTRRIQLQARDGRAFRVLSAACRSTWVTARPESQVPSASQWVEITVAPADGAIEDELLLLTDHPSAAEVAVSIRTGGFRSRQSLATPM